MADPIVTRARLLWLVAGVLAVLGTGFWSVPAQAAPYLEVTLVPIFKATDCIAGSDTAELHYFRKREQARKWLSAQLGSSVHRVVLPKGMAFIGLTSGTHATTGYGISVSDEAILTDEGILLLKTRWASPAKGEDVLLLQTATCLLLGVPDGHYRAIRVLDQQGYTRLQIHIGKTSKLGFDAEIEVRFGRLEAGF